MNRETDYRQRFVFDEIDARGCIVRLDKTCESIQATHHYPKNLAKLLNEFALAATLLRDSIKIDGSLTIQLRTAGAVKLIMADCLSDRRIRAIAEYDNETLQANDTLSLDSFAEGAVLAITITPDNAERYQSVVPIESATLTQCLTDYFKQSEQLPSQFVLFADINQAVGIALHALPQQKVKELTQSKENFERLHLLLSTLTAEEVFKLRSEELLTRLFHGESCRLFDAHSVEFGCVCSAKKSLDAIKSLGKQDVAALIDEQKGEGNHHLVVDCHFCFQQYKFDFQQLTELFVE